MTTGTRLLWFAVRATEPNHKTVSKFYRIVVMLVLSSCVLVNCDVVDFMSVVGLVVLI